VVAADATVPVEVVGARLLVTAADALPVTEPAEPVVAVVPAPQAVSIPIPRPPATAVARMRNDRRLRSPGTG
jgi:hypothetical protein